MILRRSQKPCQSAQSVCAAPIRLRRTGRRPRSITSLRLPRVLSCPIRLQRRMPARARLLQSRRKVPLLPRPLQHPHPRRRLRLLYRLNNRSGSSITVTVHSKHKSLPHVSGQALFSFFWCLPGTFLHARAGWQTNQLFGERRLKPRVLMVWRMWMLIALLAPAPSRRRRKPTMSRLS